MYQTPILQRQQQALAAARAERLEREQMEAREQVERERSNAEARKRYLDGLDAKRAEERAAAEAKLEAQIAPERASLMREWLAQDATRTEGQFNSHAWPQLRLSVIEQRERAAAEALKASLRASGRYQF
jgi:restriction endonuclease Mrr